MSSRMDKYENISLDDMSRTRRNKSIYSSTDMSEISRIKTNTNVSVISDAPKEIDIEKIKKFIYSQNEENERKRVTIELPKEEEVVVERKEIKDYDINSVLERAKVNRETDYEEDRRRKINDTQIDILKNIEIEEENKAIDDDVTGPIDDLNTEEKTIVELIQDIQNHSSSNKTTSKKDLFEELMAEDDETSVVAPIEEEDKTNEMKQTLLDITQDLATMKMPETDFTREMNNEKEIIKNEIEKNNSQETEGEEVPKIKEIDKSFYTNSMTFSKSDFEGFDDLEKGVKKNNLLTKIAIFFIIILLLATIFLILNFVFEWNII